MKNMKKKILLVGIIAGLLIIATVIVLLVDYNTPKIIRLVTKEDWNAYLQIMNNIFR